jgi:hypothetical protein
MRRAPSLTPQAVATALTASGGFDAGDFSLNFSEKGQSGSRYVGFAMIGVDGKLVQ